MILPHNSVLNRVVALDPNRVLNWDLWFQWRSWTTVSSASSVQLPFLSYIILSCAHCKLWTQPLWWIISLIACLNIKVFVWPTDVEPRCIDRNGNAVPKETFYHPYGDGDNCKTCFCGKQIYCFSASCGPRQPTDGQAPSSDLCCHSRSGADSADLPKVTTGNAHGMSGT